MWWGKGADANLLAGKQPNEWRKTQGRKWTDFLTADSREVGMGVGGDRDAQVHSVPNESTAPQRSSRELFLKYMCLKK